MRPLTLLLVPAALFAGQFRFARLGDFEGKVEVQLQAADPWMPAERNMPLVEGAWLRTGPASRLEIELDEGSAWRLGPDTQVEISDYSRLSTGQLVTLLSLDHGVAYFTGEARGKDALSLAVPGAQLVFTRGARIRLQAQESSSEVAVIEGSVTLSSPQVEVVVTEGRTLRLDPADSSILSFNGQIKAMDLDTWSEERDKALYLPAAASHVPQRNGLADLDHAGEWVQTADLGEVWKPKTPAGWVPFRNGRWRWYDSIGYAWISADPWGWLPYHYGRWTRVADLGWVWTPGRNVVFKPGDVFWLRGAKLAGWGPLAPGETWAPSSAPLQFLEANTTYAAWVQDTRLLDPAGFTDRPKEPLAVAGFVLALPSPAFVSSRLDAVRPVLQAGSTRVTPALAGVTYDPSPPQPDLVAEAADPVPAEQPSPSADPPAAPPPLPVDIVYPAPVYTGIIVMNPPDNPDYVRRPAPRAPAVAPTSMPAQAPAAPAAPRTQPAPPDKARPLPSPQPAPIHLPLPAPAPSSPGPQGGSPIAIPASPPPAAPAEPAAPRTQPVPPDKPRPLPSPQPAPIHLPLPAPAPKPVSPDSKVDPKTPAASSPAGPKSQ